MPEQLFGYTGELPTVGYTEFLQVHAAEDGGKRIVVRNTAGVSNEIIVPVEKLEELRAALGG